MSETCSKFDVNFEKKLSFQAALKHVQMLVHPDMFMATEAMVFLDEEMIIFATRLANQTIHLLKEESQKATHDTVEQAVKEIFGKNMAKWAFTAGIKAVMLFRKADDPAKRWLTLKSPFPVEKIHEDVLAEKFNEEATVYFAAVLEYVCADALESAGNRASTSSRKIIMEKDILYTLAEGEPELKVLFEIKKQKKKKDSSGSSGGGLKFGTRKKKTSTTRDSLFIPENEAADFDTNSLGGGDQTTPKSRRLSLFKAFGRKSVKVKDGAMSPGSSSSGSSTPIGSPGSSSSSLTLSSPLRAYSTDNLPSRSNSTTSTTSLPSPSPDNISISSATSETDLQRSPDLAQARKIVDSSKNIRRLSVRHHSVGSKPKTRSPLPTTQEFNILKGSDLQYQPYSRGGVLGVMSTIQEVKVHYPTSATSRLRVLMPGGVSALVEVCDEMSMAELLNYICCRRHLKMSEYTMKLVGSDTKINLRQSFASYKIQEIEIIERAENDKQDDSNLVCLVEKSEVCIVFRVTNGRYEVKAAKVYKLIERIADENSLDGYYVDTILLTFRSFVEPEELFLLLVARFKAVLPNEATPAEIAYYAQWKRPIQIKICNFIIRWIERYFQDFYEKKDLLDLLLDFCDIVHQEGIEDKASEMSQTVADQLQRFEKIHLSLLPLEKADLMAGETDIDSGIEDVESEMVPLFDKDAQFIAEQITLFNHELFNKVHRIEYVNYIWAADKMEDLCPNLNILISRFNKESYWVATQICTEMDMKKRSEVMKKFIMIGKHCLDYQNYFTVFSIVGGLNMAPVQRLKKTWELVSAKYKTQLQELESIMNPSQNMKVYRELAIQSKPPLVPVLPVYVKDLFFINDGNEKEVDNLINFEKLDMISEVVRTITAIVSIPYENFQPDKDAQRYLANPVVINNTLALKNQSLDCEPPPPPVTSS